ncbi:MAG: D-alanine--D-alanine ligase family protein [Deltaproteobacteria bacterium]
MKIGIAYDLREDYLAEGYGDEETAEFDRLDTIEAIKGTLRRLGFATNRIGNFRKLATRLVAGDRWDLVFNIAEGLRGFGREAQVPALLDAFGIPYTFSDPLVLSLTLHKGMTKHVVRDLGIPTPEFAVVESPSDIDAVRLPFPLFAKPVAEGTGKGISAASRITTRKEMDSVCRRLLAAFDQPVLLETFMPGREFTVGIIGTGEKAAAVGAIEVLLNKDAEPGAYSYVNKKKFEEFVQYRLVKDEMAQKAIEVSLAAWRGLGCRDGGRIDLRADAQGVPRFLEVNPLAGLNPEISDLPILCNLSGMSYQELISRIMDSALKRLKT